MAGGGIKESVDFLHVYVLLDGLLVEEGFLHERVVLALEVALEQS